MSAVENTKNSLEKVAGLLRSPVEVISNLEKKMSKISGKSGVIGGIAKENEEKVNQKLADLGLSRQSTAQQVYQALIERVRKNDKQVFEYFDKPDFGTTAGCQSIIDQVKKLVGDLSGFYLKPEKAKELLRLNPPKNILSNLGYNNIDQMLEKEDVFEIFPALRFVEESRWLNEVFFKEYENLKKEDFEERPIKIMVLPEKWEGIGKKFLGKKLHHMSHLKELGVIFIIPVSPTPPGETLYLLTMSLHYSYEVDWHSRLFKIYSQEKDFVKKMINALKVEVTSTPLPNDEKMSWRITPAYLAKKDINDPRLFEPHISPEAWHYTKAAKAINELDGKAPRMGLDFWKGLDVVGDYFTSDGSDGDNGKVLISFDLFDNGIALLQKRGFESKYLYHQQEALWNKVFIDYMGEEMLDKLMMENLHKGEITLN